MNDPIDPVAFTALRERALAMLERREHGVRELEEKLRSKDAGRALVRAVVEDLAGKDLVSDARYAAAFARAAIRRRPRAERRIVSELVARRVPAAIAARAVRATFAEEGVDDRGLALRSARRRARRLTSLDPAARWRRLGRYLHSHGFGTGLVAEVCREVLPPIDEEEALEEE
jgi:regulatory protein